VAGKPKKPRPFSKRGYIDEDILPLSFDTETDGLGGPLQCITACDFSKSHYFDGEFMVAEFFHLIEQFEYPFVWFAHNAQYDWRYFLDYIKRNDIACDVSMRTETDIYQIKLFIDGKKIVMRDSLAIFPGTLRDFASSFTPEIPKGDIDFDSGERFDGSKQEHRDYAIRDAMILRHGIPRFNAMLQRHFGVSIAHTTAGTALKAWMASLDEKQYFDASIYGDEEEFIRSGYFGGLVFLTRTDIVKGAETFDINSSYPHQMCLHGVPGGQRMSSLNWRCDNMGIFRVTVQAPDNLIVPILPHRDARGIMRWHRGVFETTVTNTELKFAERHGYVVIAVHEGILWEETLFPFNSFVEKCKALRKSHKGKPEETLAKLMQNSLYGKYGSRRERLTVFRRDDSDDEFSLLEALPLDDDGFWWIRKEFSDDLRCLPQWAVFITAHARLHLLDTVYRVGVENVVYGDTDSVTVLPGYSHLFDTGLDYGQFKLEKTWKTFRAIAPKVYAGQLDDGRYKGAAKGLPRKKMKEREWKALLNGDRVSVDYFTLPSLRIAMGRGTSPAKPISRISSDILNAGNWELKGHLVRPKLARNIKESVI
jgi:hypothetical protein